VSLASSFLTFTLALAIVVSAVIATYVPRGRRGPALALFVAWLLYAGMVGGLGPFTRPPGIVFYLVPLVAWVVVLTRTRIGIVLSSAIPLAVLTGLQVFRIVVELFLNELWRAGLLPKMMTFHGANFEIVLAASAPVVALLVARRMLAWQAVLVWNALGLAVLANVVVRGVLTAPGPLQLLHDDHPNLALGLFPYTYVPGLMVMLAVTLHVASMRALFNEHGRPPRTSASLDLS